jgi:hypothetical protein
MKEKRHDISRSLDTRTKILIRASYNGRLISNYVQTVAFVSVSVYLVFFVSVKDNFHAIPLIVTLVLTM